jgi:hypothetical protein
MSKKWIPLLAAMAVVAAPASAAAQSEWEHTATLYGFFPGISTTVETPRGEVESEIGFDEIWDNLDIAFFGAFEARNKRLSLVGDFQFVDLGVEAEIPANPLFSSAEIDNKLVVVGAYAMYALVDAADLRFDVGGGLRHLDVSIETELHGQGTTPDESFSAEAGWTDAVIAARFSQQFNDNWYGVAYADVGGFGIGDSSDLTWQAFAGAGYRFSETWSVAGGYRNLTIEREFGPLDVTSDVSGPFLGFQARF